MAMVYNCVAHLATGTPLSNKFEFKSSQSGRQQADPCSPPMSEV